METSIEQLKKICNDMRKDCLIMAEAAGEEGFHFGGTLSMIEIVAVLYLCVMKMDKDRLTADDRDRLILSKGHGVPAFYGVLKYLGIVNEDDLKTFKTRDARLFGHPNMNPEMGVEFSSGSLGQGLSQGVGVALALKKKKMDAHVYVVMGDGECDEGSVWEAAMSASKFDLDNLMVIVDKNHIQYDGDTENVMPLASLEEKFNSFGWDVVRTDGHDLQKCYAAFSNKSEKPILVIADTVKGKGISFMENQSGWHHGKLTKSQSEAAWKELCDDRI